MTLTQMNAKPVGSLDAAFQAPLDYRFALDAAMGLLFGTNRLAVICRQPALMEEVVQRTSDWQAGDDNQAGLWVEPMQPGWQADLHTLVQQIAPGGKLILIVSRPLARLLPERRGWGGKALGMQPGGVRALRQALVRAGFDIQACYGIHTWQAVGLQTLGQTAASLGQPHLGDRLSCAARQTYCTDGISAGLGTVALISAVRLLKGAGQ